MLVGTLMQRYRERNLQHLPGLFKEMKLTTLVFFILAMSVVGMPPTSGFFSKFYLVGGALEQGHPEFALALLFASLANAFIFLRIFERAYYQPTETPAVRPLPPIMTGALLMVAAAVLALGMGSGFIYENFIFPVAGMTP